MTGYEYATATSGYVHCSCLTCMDITVGTADGELCCLCEDAGCEAGEDCQRDDIWERS